MAPDTIDSIIDSIAIIVGFLGVIIALVVNHKTAMRLQKDNDARQLRLEIYSELSEETKKASSAFHNVAGYDSAISGYLSIARARQKDPNAPLIIGSRLRAELFSKYHFDFTASLISLMSVVEKYEIVEPKFAVFRLAISLQIDHISEAFNSLSVELWLRLPRENPDGSIHYPPLDDGTVTLLLAKLDKHQEHVWDMGGTIFDFGVESQKALIGGLFPKNKLSGRVAKPGVDLEIIRLDDAQEYARLLQKYQGLADARTEQVLGNR